MKSKTLILTAALGMVASAAAVAQVYSVNAVGYVNVDAPKGFSMVANPLDNTKGNKIGDVLAGAPDGTIVYKYTGTGFAINTFDLGEWSDVNMTLAPGEGAFLRLPAATKLTFVGEVKQGNLQNPLPKGFSIRSSMVPQKGALDTVLKFPGADGDIVYFYRGTGYVISTFDFGAFDPPALPEVGEAFWVRSTTAKSWDRTFSVN